ncbi:DNA/RNA helicase domain-containing protein [Metallosphaera hakonensis]|uniref:DNA/RNA helicase domain-containing protein n=1 Tax=Metallosphaera hakonensis TaxID=79601 RepID=UPI000A95AA45|nr:DNA/RNA helicase domain-containing protein [Metallosphaera hakonensis]
MPLPVILQEITQNSFGDLVTSYKETFKEDPSIEQKNAWKKLLEIFNTLNTPHPIIMEYPIFTDRVDAIFVDESKALILEAKGWKQARRKDDITVESDGELRLDPCYQLNNYVTKMNTFHSSGIRFEGALFLYNTNDYSSSECEVLRNPNDLKVKLKNYSPRSRQDVDKIVNGKFVLTTDFVKFLAETKNFLQQSIAKAILPYGYGLTEEQGLILSKVLNVLEDRASNKNFLVRGGSGSGKSLLAITLFLETLSRGYFTILSYKNQRLLNSIKLSLTGLSLNKTNDRDKVQALSQFIMFYSTGFGFGVGESNFSDWFKEKFGDEKIDLVVYDEAQRMTTNVIKKFSQGKSKRVFLR